MSVPFRAKISLVTLALIAPHLTSAATVLITGANKVESVVVATDGYFVGSMDSAGGVIKYGWTGEKITTWDPITGLEHVRGLAIHGDKLYVAHEGGVNKYSVGNTSAVEDATYDVSAQGCDKPNGLCLNADGSKLYVTDPGWSAANWQAQGTSSLVEIDTTDGTAKSLIDGTAGQSPNGCVVDGTTVFMSSLKDGVTTYDLDGKKAGSASWSSAIKQYEEDNQAAGDGIVMHGGKFYVSAWKPAMPPTGKIWECDPAADPASACSVFSTEVACDMKLDSHITGDPKLLAPNIIQNKVMAISLTTSAPTTAAGTPTATEPAAAGSSRSSRMAMSMLAVLMLASLVSLIDSQ